MVLSVRLSITNDSSKIDRGDRLIEKDGELEKGLIANLFVGQSEGSVTWPAGTRRREETEIYSTGCANTVELPCIRFGENFSLRTPVLCFPHFFSPPPPIYTRTRFFYPSLSFEFLSGTTRKSSITSKRYRIPLSEIVRSMYIYILLYTIYNIYNKIYNNI